jgi:hypothetical protein
VHTTPTQQADLQAACKKALTSTAFAKFVSQAVHAAFVEQQSQPEGIVLTPKPTTRLKFSDLGCACSYEVRSADGMSEFRMQRSFEGYQHLPQQYWYGRESHTDTQGRVWSCQLPNMVQDDFGVLVKVKS